MRIRKRPQPEKEPVEDLSGKTTESEEPDLPVLPQDDLGVSVSTSASETRPRCAFCRSDVLVAAVRCPDCTTTLHRDCLRSAGKCPTLGCETRASEFEGLRRGAPPVALASEPLSPAKLVLLIVLLSLIPLFISAVTVVISRSPQPTDEAWWAVNAEDVDELTDALADHRERVRKRAMIALGDLGEQAKPAVPPLLRALRGDADPSSREEAAEALARIDQPLAVDSVLGELERGGDGDVRRRYLFAVALVKVSKQAKDRERVVAALERCMLSDPVRVGPYVELLEAVDSEATFAVLGRALAPHDGQLGVGAVRELERLGTPRALSLVAGAVKHSDPQVRLRIAQALPRLGNRFGRQPAADALCELLQDDVAEVRHAASEGLSSLPSSEARAVVEPLLAALRDDDARVRRAAGHALIVVSGESASELFLRLLESEHRETRYEAVEALKRIGNPSALAALRAVAENGDEEADVRRAAQSALEAIAGLGHTRERGE